MNMRVTAENLISTCNTLLLLTNKLKKMLLISDYQMINEEVRDQTNRKLDKIDEEVSKLFKNRVYIKTESQIINDTKYVLFSDYYFEEYSVLLYNESGNAKLIGQAINPKIRNKIRLTIKWHLFKTAAAN